MIKQCRQYDNLTKEKIHLIYKIRHMENVIWDNMLEDLNLGKNTIDIDNLIDRFEHTKNIYNTQITIRNLMKDLKEE